MALNGIQTSDDITVEKEKLEQADDEKYRNIFTFLYGINQDLDLFAKYRVDRIFECRILSVDQHYRGLGLAKQLLQKSIEIAQEAGFKVRLIKQFYFTSFLLNQLTLTSRYLNKMQQVSTLRR